MFNRLPTSLRSPCRKKKVKTLQLIPTGRSKAEVVCPTAIEGIIFKFGPCPLCFSIRKKFFNFFKKILKEPKINTCPEKLSSILTHTDAVPKTCLHVK